MIVRRLAGRLASTRGASMVEFALILPIFVVLVFGMIEFSLLFYDKAVITNGCREGARFATMYFEVPGSGVPLRKSIQQIKDHVRNYCQAYLITFQTDRKLVDSDIFLTVGGAPYDPTTFNAGQILMVEVRYPYRFLVFPNIIGLLGGGGWTSDVLLRANSQMRAE